jgi:hypothetical protein
MLILLLPTRIKSLHLTVADVHNVFNGLFRIITAFVSS